MKIKVQTYSSEHENSVMQFVKNILESKEHGAGAVEINCDEISILRSAFARLCETLAEKKILDAEEVVEIVHGYTYPAKFIDE